MNALWFLLDHPAFGTGLLLGILLVTNLLDPAP